MTECAIYSEAVTLCFYGNAPPIVRGLMAFKALPVDIKAVAPLNYLPGSIVPWLKPSTLPREENKQTNKKIQ